MGAPEWIARFQGLLGAAVGAKRALVEAALHLPGFQFDETMRGKVSFSGVADVAPGERDITLQLRATVPRFGDYLREGRTTLTGSATVAGLVDTAPVSGSLWILPHRRIVRYEVSFPVGNRRLRLVGQKDVRLLHFRHTMSTLPAKLYDRAGVEVGEAMVVFDWADLPSFLRSFTPVHSPAAPPQAAAPDDSHLHA